MALNPPLFAAALGVQLLPLALHGETFLLHRDGIDATLECGAPLGRQQLRGAHLIVSTLRLCVLAPAPNGAGMCGVEIPFVGLSAEEFCQPILGAHYLKGVVAPLPGRGLTGPTPFRITFKNGGAATFLRIFFAIMDRYRTHAPAAREAWLAPPAACAWVATQTAYCDPADPSRLFLVQPQPQPQMPSAPPPAAGQGAWGGGGGGGYAHAAL